MATMATVKNYNEVTHTKRVDYSVLDPMYKWDVHFPDHISRLTINEDFHHNRSSSQKRRGGRSRARNTNRYKTQPITFDEIKEVDEEKSFEKTDGADDKEKDGLKSQFTAFSRSMDGLVPGYPGLPRKRNMPLKPSPLVTGAPTALPVLPQSPENSSSTKDGDISLSIKVPQRTTTNAENMSQSSESIKESPSTPEKSPPGATSPSTSVTSQELSAIGLKALPDLPQDSSRARRAKRRQKKLIEEEPEIEAGKNSSGTG